MRKQKSHTEFNSLFEEHVNLIIHPPRNPIKKQEKALDLTNRMRKLYFQTENTEERNQLGEFCRNWIYTAYPDGNIPPFAPEKKFRRTRRELLPSSYSPSPMITPFYEYKNSLIKNYKEIIRISA